MSYKTEGNPVLNNKPTGLLTDQVSPLLLEWYSHNKRDLPWRHTRDPYLIWLSEIILQQTRIAQGLPYYQQFTKNFPTVQAFAEANENDILRLWQGLGYYSRARNMLKTAREVTESHKGVFPADLEALKKLKGVGDYTAAAIASFAYRIPAPVVDGNVYRFLARLMGIDTDINSSKAKAQFTEIARALMPADQPDIFNQAIMEFGALQCTPVSPACDTCPFQSMCFAYQHAMQGSLPVKIKKGKIKLRHLNYLVFRCDNEIAMRKRNGKDVWSGLYEFYLVETDKAIEEWDSLPLSIDQISLIEPNQLSAPSATIVHQLTHQKLQIRFWPVIMNKNKSINLPEDFRFYTASETEQLPKPVVINNYLKKDFF